jgi:tRNA threonylcarbamoyladenosine biosynthesis protein TsaE
MDSCTTYLPDAQSTRHAGASLAATLYARPLTIGLTGDLGAGKTTFLQGFLEALGCRDSVTSPTYALEQRYDTPAGEVLHLDLYRLTEPQAQELLRSSDDHPGIRCIEWPERAGGAAAIDIAIHLQEEGEGRSVRCLFGDAPLPTRRIILGWRKDMLLPAHIAAHCDAVADLAGRLADALQADGTILRPLALRRAAECHDLLRFVDFRDQAAPEGFTNSDEESYCWHTWKERYAGLRHEPACAAFLREHGYDALAQIVEPHGLHLPSPERRTIEQQLLYYADKRVRVDTVVTLEERFADFATRYGGGQESAHGKIWFAEAKALEQSLFGGRIIS